MKGVEETGNTGLRLAGVALTFEKLRIANA